MSVAVRSPARKKAAPDPADLLAWYDRHRRVLPWRARKGERPDPYRVWLSEIMLQQTTVKAVAPYYARFLARWPTVEALAAADLDDVLRAWAGLGYYARARNLHACAQAVVAQHGGIFPDELAALRALPGIGDYTAAAVAAIAFDAPAVPVDGNVERVVARLFAVEEHLPAAKPEIKRLAASLLPPQPRRRFRAGADGSGRDAVLAQAAGLRAVPMERRVRRLCARRSGDLPAQDAQARRQVAARRGLRRAARRRLASFCASVRTKACSPR